MNENYDESITNIKDVLNDFANAEDLPPSTRVHLSCATLALLREQDEIFASRDFVPQPICPEHSSWRDGAGSNHNNNSYCCTSTSTAKVDLAFQQAYCRAASNAEYVKTLAHMENMYAAAVQDLWLAQESTVTRQNAWVSESLQSLQEGSNHQTDNVMNTQLQNSAALIEQYRTEIQHTKIEHPWLLFLLPHELAA